ncbi:MAG: hypothetical protein GY823_05110, partial [Flavobacteriaceae bacterium]|nr:hypothetical protein [Flavobacteriaceae bacterium]
KRINEAEGHAKEIEAIAQATAESINKIASAIVDSNGQEAINMKLSQQYLSEFSKLNVVFCKASSYLLLFSCV